MNQKYKIRSTVTQYLRLLLKFISCQSLGLIFTCMDVLSYGRNIFPTSVKGNNLENLSMVIYLYSTCCAQIIWSYFTKIDSGIMCSAAIESLIIIHKIIIKCAAESDDMKFIVTNTLLCMFLATLLYSFISFALKKYKFSRFFKLIPKAAITGCFGAIGICQFQVGFNEIKENHVFDENTIKFFLLVLIISIIGYIIQEKYNDVYYILPVYITSVILIFYFIFFVVLKCDMKHLSDYKWLHKQEKVVLHLSEFKRYFSLSKVNFICILKNSFNIISMALFCSIFLLVNLPAFKFFTKVNYDFDDELGTQAIGNLFSSLFCMPTYFICSYSVFFNRSGGKTKFSAIAMGFVLLLLIYIGPVMKPYIPRIVLGTIPFIIGISIFHNVYYNSFFDTCIFDYLNIVITSLVAFYLGIIQGLLLGILLNIITFIKDYINEIKIENYKIKSMNHNNCKITKEILERKDIGILKINYILSFITFEKFLNDIENLKSKKIIIIDLRDCYSIDWMSLDYLNETIMNYKKKGVNIFIVGEPINKRYTITPSNGNEFKFFNNYEEIMLEIERFYNYI